MNDKTLQLEPLEMLFFWSSYCDFFLFYKFPFRDNRIKKVSDTICHCKHHTRHFHHLKVFFTGRKNWSFYRTPLNFFHGITELFFLTRRTWAVVLVSHHGNWSDLSLMGCSYISYFKIDTLSWGLEATVSFKVQFDPEMILKPKYYDIVTPVQLLYYDDYQENNGVVTKKNVHNHPLGKVTFGVELLGKSQSPGGGCRTLWGIIWFSGWTEEGSVLAILRPSLPLPPLN